MVRKQSRTAPTWVIALGVLVLLVVAAFVVVTVLNKERNAHATLEQYLHALAAGDATTAASLLEAERTPSPGPDLLTDEVLANAEELISDISVVTVAGGPSPTLEGSFTLNGQRYTQTFNVREGEPEWGFLKTYQVELPDKVSVTPIATNDVDVELAGVHLKSTTPQVYLFPAVYPVAAIDPTYMDLAEDVFVVTGEESPEPVEAVPTPALIEQAQQQVNEAFDECVELATDDHVLHGCPLLFMGDQGTWEVLEYPTVEQVETSLIARGARAEFIFDGTGDRYDRSYDYIVDVDIKDGEANIQVYAR